MRNPHHYDRSRIQPISDATAFVIAFDCHVSQTAIAKPGVFIYYLALQCMALTGTHCNKARINLR